MSKLVCEGAGSCKSAEIKPTNWFGPCSHAVPHEQLFTCSMHCYNSIGKACTCVPVEENFWDPKKQQGGIVTQL